MTTLTKEQAEHFREPLKRQIRRDTILHIPISDELKAVDQLIDLAIQAIDMRPRPISEKPRRKIVMLAKFEADDWDAMQGTFHQLETQIAMHGELSPRSISGGYSTGHIYVCDVDGNMTHDKWAKELDAYLSSLPTGGE
jgi:hypothetical protein